MTAFRSTRLVARMAVPVTLGIALAPLTMAAPVAATVPASSGSVEVSNTETVQAFLDATGKVTTARIYDQVAMQGKGTVDLRNPVSMEGLRNLDSFGGFETKDGAIVGTYTVDGQKRLRAVSDYTKKLPLSVSVSYLLDGKEVKPGDVVGKSGLLQVQYTVKNLTGEKQVVKVPGVEGTGAEVSESVVIPMVGSLTTTLPSNFTDVSSNEANMAGDGRGGTKMSYTMTLFGPIGQPEATFGYTAKITDGVVPRASISVLPVNPLASPSFKGGAASYKSGAESGRTLRDGAIEIDSNLLALRDGAGQLLAGLIKLRDGATKLEGGLVGSAAPGAQQLAAGAGTLADGTNQVDTGAGALADGLSQAGDSAPALIDGLQQLQDGLGQVDDGLAQLYGGIGQLPPKAQPLHDGIAQLRAGIGSTSAAGTLLYGVDQVRSGLADAVSTGGPIDQLKGGVAAAATKSGDCGSNCQGILADVQKGLDGMANETRTASAGLAMVQCGLSNQSLGVCDASKAGLLQGLGALDAGVTQLVDGVVEQVQGGVGTASDTKDSGTLRGGIHGLQDGVGQIQDGGALLLAGLDQLTTGAATLKGGTAQLATGSSTLAVGAGTLASGLGDAASGSTQLADGLTQAAGSAPKLEDGAQQLSDKGMSKLVAAGKETAMDYGTKYALIEAGAKRAQTESMAFGAPEGAASATAYSLELTAADGQSGANIGRLLGAVVIFGLVGAAVFLRRRKA